MKIWKFCIKHIVDDIENKVKSKQATYKSMCLAIIKLMGSSIHIYPYKQEKNS